MFIQFLGTAASVYGVLGDQIAPAGAVSEHFGAGQLLLVAHDASGPPRPHQTDCRPGPC